jgi:seryl-tRNA synthetase
LNGTAAAIPRLLVALLENGVKFDQEGQPAKICLPKALQSFWIGGDQIGEGKVRGAIEWL